MHQGNQLHYHMGGQGGLLGPGAGAKPPGPPLVVVEATGAPQWLKKRSVIFCRAHNNVARESPESTRSSCEYSAWSA